MSDILPPFKAPAMPMYLFVRDWGAIPVAVEKLTDEQAAEVWRGWAQDFVEHVRKRRAMAKAGR